MGRRATQRAKERNRRLVTISIVVAIIAVVVVLTLIVESTYNDPYAKYIGMPVSPSVLQEITGVSPSTLSTIGKPSGVTAPLAITGPSLTVGGKPEVLYVGAEYCPFCALERWSLIIALSQFGNFTGLEYMQSSPTDQNANTPTFTFVSSNYTSPYIAFVPVEEFNRATSTITTLSSYQSSAVSAYDTCGGTTSAGGIPFIDIANSWAVSCGAQSTLDLSGQNWTKVASVLDNPNSNTAQLIDGAANTLITAICKVDGGQPSSVCTQSYADVTLAYTTTGTAGTAGQQALVLLPQPRDEARWTGSAKHF
jgi:hypothetical protein